MIECMYEFTDPRQIVTASKDELREKCRALSKTEVRYGARLAPGDYDATMERYEREVIEAGLAQGHGRIAETCRLLGISRNTLRERMRRYGLGPAGLIGDGSPEGDG
jgi:DNA-binding NtrC family response regulator